MIPREEILKLIVKLKTPYFRVYDMGGKLLCQYDEGTNPQEAADTLKEWYTFLGTYGRVMIHGANESQYKQKWTNCYKWECLLNDNSPGKTSGHVPVQIQPASLTSQMGEMLALFKMFESMRTPAADKNWEVELLKIKYDHAEQMREFEKKNSDPAKMIAGAAPIVMTLLGWDQDKIQKTMSLAGSSYNMAAGNNTPARISGPNLSTDIPSLEEIEQLSPEELTNQCQQCLEQMPQKVAGTKLLLLFKLIVAKPELVDKALDFHKQGFI